MLTKEEIEYKVINNCISTLAVICTADFNKIMDLLTGYLWDEEEAGGIKRAPQPIVSANGADAVCTFKDDACRLGPDYPCDVCRIKPRT